MPDTDAAFEGLARAALDDLLEAMPETATTLGDHRFDDRLADLGGPAVEEGARRFAARLAELDRIDTGALSVDNQVDAQILRTALTSAVFEATELREHEWNPLVANPGDAVYSLLARDFAPLADRLVCLAGRMAAIPEALATARRTLGAMPRIHLQTALTQFGGTQGLLGPVLEEALAAPEAGPALRARVQPAREAALTAVTEHIGWLTTRLADTDGPGRDPRIGPERFATKLALTLDTTSAADDILARAEADLDRITERLAELATRITGVSRRAPEVIQQVLDSLAADHLDNATILPACRESFAKATQFVRDMDLVTIHDDPVEIIEMPEIHRGVAVAYCDPPGPLETVSTTTFFAVSPTPSDWSAERVASFYREYNAHLVHNLTVHEAMPGHVLQLSHSNRCVAPTPIRAALWSGPFVEGWAVVAEELMAERGYRGADNDALRMQQLKMQLRTTINAILDARVHAHGMTEAEAMALMTGRGMQEEGEAAGKWRRALLSSAQLSTYYVGYTEVAGALRDLRAARPGDSDRQIHDALLSRGSPSPRHLRTLLHI